MLDAFAKLQEREAASILSKVRMPLPGCRQRSRGVLLPVLLDHPGATSTALMVAMVGRQGLAAAFRQIEHEGLWPAPWNTTRNEFQGRHLADFDEAKSGFIMKSMVEGLGELDKKQV